MPDQDTISSTSQKFLDIYDITNNLTILKNGSASMILTVNAMNFGLLAEAEQDAVIYSYASLLNSLNFPIQIVIRSETKDASSYLKILKEREGKTTDQVKKGWIQRYSQFISNLIQERNVLDKKFYVVIPAGALEMGLSLGQNIISGFKEQTIEGVEKSVIVEKAITLLEPKRDHLIAQFNRIGLYARQLNTQEIIRLFYTNYNPEATEGQQITDSQSYTTPLVQAQIKGDFMSNQPPQPQSSNQLGMTTPAADNQPVEGQTVDGQPVEEQLAGEQPIEEQAPTAPPTTAQQSAEKQVSNSAQASITESPSTQPPAKSTVPSAANVVATINTPAQPNFSSSKPTSGNSQPMSSGGEPVSDYSKPTNGEVEITSPQASSQATEQNAALVENSNPQGSSLQNNNPQPPIDTSTPAPTQGLQLKPTQPASDSTQPTDDLIQPTGDSTQPASGSTQPASAPAQPTTPTAVADHTADKTGETEQQAQEEINSTLQQLPGDNKQETTSAEPSE